MLYTMEEGKGRSYNDLRQLQQQTRGDGGVSCAETESIKEHAT